MLVMPAMPVTPMPAWEEAFRLAPADRRRRRRRRRRRA